MAAPVSAHFHFSISLMTPAVTLGGVWSQVRPYKGAGMRLEPTLEQIFNKVECNMNNDSFQKRKAVHFHFSVTSHVFISSNH